MKRTQLICLHEGKQNSIDPIFVNTFIKTYNPQWLRPLHTGMIRLVPCHGKVSLLEQFPKELSQCGKMGGNTTLVVMADVDDDCEHCDALKKKYRQAAKDAHIADDLFNQVVFVFPKDRIENWIQYLNTGTTDETREGPRVSNPDAVSAARKLAEKCKSGSHNDDFPPSLKWSCKNWKTLLDRMQHD